MATLSIEELNRTPLGRFPRLFSALVASDLASVPGFYRAEFVGPPWLRAIAPRGLALIHLSHWWGKELRADCTGFNIVGGKSGLQRSLSVRVTMARSVIDGRQVVEVRYPSGNPFPWTHVMDELRELDEVTLLGMTLVDAPLLRRLPLPFLLHREGRPYGL